MQESSGTNFVLLFLISQLMGSAELQLIPLGEFRMTEAVLGQC